MTDGGRVAVVAIAALVVWLVLGGAAAAQPSEADVHVAEGIIALEEQQYLTAIDRFRQALAREPDHVEALYLTGVALMALGQPADAVPVLERAHRKSPADAPIAYQLGLAHLALGQPARAEPLLEAAFATAPTLDSLGYHLGFLRYQKKEYASALRAFEKGRTSDPNIAQLTRIYAGLSLAALGLPGQGAEEIEQALRLQPGAPVTGPAARLRATLAARGEERRLRVAARVGFFHDDNVRAAPDAAPESLVVTELRHARRDSTGELLSVGADYDWLRRGPWTAGVGYAFLTTYNNDLPDLNVVNHLGVASVSRQDVIAAMPLESELRYSIEYVTLDGDELLLRNSIAASAGLTPGARHFVGLLTRVDFKDFSNFPQALLHQDTDATNWMIGVLHLLRFDRDRHFVKTGYQYDIEEATGRDFSYVGHRILVGGQSTLPWQDVRLSYDFGFHYRDYPHPNTLFPERHPGTRSRSDREYTHRVQLALPFSIGSVPGGFEALAEFLRTDAHSNLSVYQYRRDVFSLSLAWRY